MVFLITITLLVFSSFSIFAQEDIKDWAAYQDKYSLHCFPPVQKLKSPIKINDLMEFDGYKLTIKKTDKDKNAIIGVLSSVKDFFEDTQKNLKKFIKFFKKEKVEVIVLNGDLSDTQEDMVDILTYIAKSINVPILVMIGNTESVGTFNSAVETASKQYSNIVNINYVRLVDADDYDLLILPGYYDRRYTHAGGSCIYRESHLEKISSIFNEVSNIPIFVSHGPPLGEIKNAIDAITDGRKNVGDEKLTNFMKKNEIKAGIFGHILEAGGQAMNLQGNKSRKQNKWYKELLVNYGSASSTLWDMNKGSLSKGMAGIFYVKDNKFKYVMKFIR